MCNADFTLHTLPCQPLDMTLGPCTMNGPVRARTGRSPGETKCLSPVEVENRERGEVLKRHVRAAAALAGLYGDTAIGEAVNMTRAAVGAWWTGARMQPDALLRLADATNLDPDELASFVYWGGPPPKLPPSGPAGLRLGIERAQEDQDDEDPGTPVPSPERPPRDA